MPEDHAGFLDLCQKLHKAGKPAGFALGNAKGDGNGFANWVLWSHNASLLDEEGNVTINSKETIAALNWVKELYPTFIAGTPSWNDVSNNRAYSSQEISLTANGVSLYFSLKNDPATKAIAEDSEHQLLPKGLAKISPMAGPDAERDAVQAQPVSQRGKGVPAVHAGEGPVRAVAQRQLRLLVAAARRLCRRQRSGPSDPKVKIFKDTMNSTYYDGYKGPISTATGAVSADYVLVQMCAAVATGASTPEAAAAEAEQRAKRYFRRQDR